MEIIRFLIDLALHLDEHVGTLVENFGGWAYGILFLALVLETWIVFLPSRTLIFATGTFAAQGVLNPLVLLIFFALGAALGDTINYWIGAYIGPRAFTGKIKYLKKEYLEQTRDFYDEHGGKTLIFARFIPIIKTFAPVLAGIGTWSYTRYLVYNLAGIFLWVSVFLFGGYFFGSIPFVQNNFDIVMIAVIMLYIAIMAMEFLRSRKKGSANTAS
ncbi:MAG: VTT domain-containing protein [Anaerolineales bacterium]|nr:VTT domain-containing protein [Anaerolineales bacterium]